MYMNKKAFLFSCLLLGAAVCQAQSGRIGIGTSNPLARLHVADSNVLFSAPGDITASPLPPPVEGPGRRMMWYVDKAAFRVGYVDGNNWNIDAVGNYSLAAGNNCLASGPSSTALGDNSQALGLGSLAVGTNCLSSGPRSFSAGQENQSTGTNSVSLGELTVASGTNAAAWGQNTRAFGFASLAAGGASEARGSLSVALNFATISYGASATAAGYQSIANGNHSFVVGAFNDTLVTRGYDGFRFDNPLFIVGNGDDLQGLRRSNALVVYQSGNTDHNGYTRLGKASEGAPLIKVKEISNAVSAATDGGVITIPHGLFRFNILSLTALLVYGNGDVIPGFRGTPGYEYSIAFDDTNIYIYNITGNSANILSKPLKITITYKE